MGSTKTAASSSTCGYADLDCQLLRHLAFIAPRCITRFGRAFAQSGAALEADWTIVDVAGRRRRPGAALRREGAERRRRSISSSTPLAPARPCARCHVTPANARSFAYGAVWASVPDLAIAPAMLAQRYVAARIMIGHLPVGRTRAHRRRSPLFLELEAGRLRRLAGADLTIGAKRSRAMASAGAPRRRLQGAGRFHLRLLHPFHRAPTVSRPTRADRRFRCMRPRRSSVRAPIARCWTRWRSQMRLRPPPTSNRRCKFTRGCAEGMCASTSSPAPR